MNFRAFSFVLAVTLMGLAVLLGQQWSDFSVLTSHDILGVASFLALGIFADALAIRFAVGSNRHAHTSFSFLPVLASAILFPPVVVVSLAGALTLTTEIAIRARVLWIVVLNTALSIVTVSVAIGVANTFGGVYAEPFELNLLAFSGLVGTSFFANIAIVSGFVSLRSGKPYVAVARQILGPSGGNVLYGILSSPIALLIAYLYDRLYIGGIVLVILPLLLIRYSYLSKLQLEQANKDLLRVLIKTIETRDPYTSGHSVRVSKIAGAIARDLGLPRRRIEQVETAALLHDVGKIDMLYASIIQKPTPLTEDESRIIKTHAVKGAELLQSLSSLPEEVVRGVRHHHERYDGKGYPDGLVGKEIPLVSRIIMLCDSIDAMLSDRPYREAMSVDEVAAEIVRCSGSQFDPDIVDTIIRSGTLERAAELVGDEALSFDPGFQILQSR